VNGRTGELPFGGRAADYVIAPGENLAIAVDMTIPPHTSTTVTALWMGITSGVLTAGPNGPAHMAPILVADTRASLGPGSYRFTLHWSAPTSLRSGATRQLFAEVAWSHGATGRLIAEFNVRDSLSIQSHFDARSDTGPNFQRAMRGARLLRPRSMSWNVVGLNVMAR
jgi:hypothetical protein